MSLLEFRQRAEGARVSYPGFAIPIKPPREGFLVGTCRRN